MRAAQYRPTQSRDKDIFKVLVNSSYSAVYVRYAPVTFVPDTSGCGGVLRGEHSLLRGASCFAHAVRRAVCSRKSNARHCSWRGWLLIDGVHSLSILMGQAGRMGGGLASQASIRQQSKILYIVDHHPDLVSKKAFVWI
jgi:hypothetical protein